MKSVDIIIPNYNGAALLPACLDALTQQSRPARIIMVDDCSQDASVALVLRQYPQVIVIAHKQNGGFVQAANTGLAASRADFVVLLNNDTEPEPTWLEHLIAPLERYPGYAATASKLRLWHKRDHLHSTGDGYGWDGIPFSRGVWEHDHGQYDALAEVFGACAGAAAYRRSALAAVALPSGAIFDPELVMYCEDVELNLRLRRAGFGTLFVPQAVVYHHLSATGGGVLASYYCGRNFLTLWAKHMPPGYILHSLPFMLRAQLRITRDALRAWRGAAAQARLRGQIAGLQRFPVVWQQRRFRASESQQLVPWLGDTWTRSSV